MTNEVSMTLEEARKTVKTHKCVSGSTYCTPEEHTDFCRADGFLEGFKAGEKSMRMRAIEAVHEFDNELHGGSPATDKRAKAIRALPLEGEKP